MSVGLAVAILLGIIIGAYFVGVLTGWVVFRCRKWMVKP
jgi:hypothetical protein